MELNERRENTGNQGSPSREHRMSRREFTKPTKRAALARSGGKCEATGPWYGWPEGHRCNADLAYGVEFDHFDLDANSKDNSLENCAATCRKCHAFKSRTRDIPLAAKTLRQQDKHNGIRRAKRKIPSRGFGGWKDNTKYLDHL